MPQGWQGDSAGHRAAALKGWAHRRRGGFAMTSAGVIVPRRGGAPRVTRPAPAAPARKARGTPARQQGRTPSSASREDMRGYAAWARKYSGTIHSASIGHRPRSFVTDMQREHPAYAARWQREHPQVRL